MDFLDLLQSAMRRYVGDDYAERRYVIAVSGGRDSMALLHALAAILPSRRFSVAHFNHRQRGARSVADEKFVLRACGKQGVVVEVGRARRKFPASEQALRVRRWAFLNAVRERQKADFVVTAHHGEDQWETVIQRLLRGTGARGVSGMRPKASRRLKPFLEMPREAIERYVERHAIAYREDETNTSPKFLRNRVRHEITPRVKKAAEDFGGWELFVKRFSATLSDLREDRRHVEARARRLERALFRETPFWIRIEKQGWDALEIRWKRELLIRLYRRLRARIPTRGEVEEALGRLDQGQKHATLAGGVEMEASCGWLFFHGAKERRRLEKTRLHAGKSSDGWRASCPQLGLEIEGKGTFECRFPRAGDRLGNRKLKQCLLADRIPAPERRFLPVVAEHNSSRVAWYFPKQNKTISVKALSFPFSFLEGM